MTVTSRRGSELIAELRARGALSYQAALPVQSLALGSNYILDQLLTIGVVREGRAPGTYYVDEETLAPIHNQARYVRLIGYGLAALVLVSVIGAVIAELLF